MVADHPKQSKLREIVFLCGCGRFYRDLQKVLESGGLALFAHLTAPGCHHGARTRRSAPQAPVPTHRDGAVAPIASSNRRLSGVTTSPDKNGHTLLCSLTDSWEPVQVVAILAITWTGS